MQKKLKKFHREARAQCSSSADESSDAKQMKMEHLARCNAAYHPSAPAMTNDASAMPADGQHVNYSSTN